MTAKELPRGRVMRVDARVCEVALEGEVIQARLRGKLFEKRGEDLAPVSVGDWVELSHDEDGSAIESVLPRRNSLARRAAGEEVRRQVIASNLDQIILVGSFGNPPFSSVTTDRIFVSASFLGVDGVLVLNKTDRAKARKITPIVETYEAAGYRVLLTSAKTRQGIEELSECLAGKTSVLSGMSGVGKSSLLNLIQPGLGLKTREVSKSLSTGRHTTTYARMYELERGGYVIDTPGMRVFRPYGLPPAELRLHFPELASIGTQCRFPDCQHRSEPGCQVLAARKDGRFPESRYRSYLEILSELEEVYGGTGRKKE